MSKIYYSLPQTRSSNSVSQNFTIKLNNSDLNDFKVFKTILLDSKFFTNNRVNKEKTRAVLLERHNETFELLCKSGHEFLQFITKDKEILPLDVG